MRDYGNIPSVSWNHDLEAAYKAKAQILISQPVVIDMPDTLRYELCPSDFNCRMNPETGILHNCDGAPALRRLAELNIQPRLNLIAQAVHRTSAILDIDPDAHRLIIHH
jgi:hypothetical protein